MITCNVRHKYLLLTSLSRLVVTSDAINKLQVYICTPH